MKQTKDYLEKVVNDNLNVTRLPPMVEEEESDSTSKHPSDWSQPSMQEEAYSMSKSSCISNNNSHHSKEERQQQTATFPGIVAWKDVFEDEILKLPDTSFMSQLRQAVPHEQFRQIANEILRTMQKSDYMPS